VKVDLQARKVMPSPYADIADPEVRDIHGSPLLEEVSG
jgi:hypothetical protein